VKQPLLVLLLLLAACTSTSSKLEQMYSTGLHDRQQGVFASLEATYEERQESRRAKVRSFIAEAKLESAEDHVFAAAILASSPAPEDLAAAQRIGLRAAEMGDGRGFRVAAEAIDRQAMHAGSPQRYGTQYYYEEVLQKWRLYAVDPHTTDAERKAMGVAPMAQLMERTEVLNSQVR
jgi:hypothetical protein